MNSRQFNQAIGTFSKAIYEIIEAHGFVNELTEKNSKNPLFFAPNLSKIASKELAWMGTNYEAKYDLMSEAFTNIMLHRAKTLFNNFKTKESGEQKAPIEQFLNLIFSREVSRLSQQEYKRMKREKNVVPIEDESFDEAFERVIHSTPSIDQGRISSGLDDIDQYIKDYEDRIKQLKKEQPEGWKKRVETVKAKIEKLKDKKDKLLKDAKLSIKVENSIEEKFSLDEELAFEQLVGRLQKELRRETNSDVYITILEMLIAGFSKSDIARFLGVSSAKVSQRLKKVKELISEIAEMQQRKGDDTLMQVYNKFSKATTSGIRDVMNMEMLTKQVSALNIR